MADYTDVSDRKKHGFSAGPELMRKRGPPLMRKRGSGVVKDPSEEGCVSWYPDSPWSCSDGSGICMSDNNICDGFKVCDDGGDENDCGWGETDGNGCTKPRQIGNTGIDDLKKQILDAHNYFRCLHGSPPLVWDKTLERFGKGVATDNKNKGTIEHAKNNKYGENLAMNMLESSDGITGFGFTKMWYDEIKDYNFNNPGFDWRTGHFTALLWKDTKKVGCDFDNRPDDFFTQFYVACEYDPPGNDMTGDAFEQNVLPLL
uniref:Cell wall protein PRY3-like isoform X2 n=1 Tax=Saccoglossus kowalevskii TaxID=10224 RepID=A0ABM0MNP1_SACKO|nr:PREDICTED: cell wall protein PRY3-like isoform X2 [Saccoglossus kowalevskii]